MANNKQKTERNKETEKSRYEEVYYSQRNALDTAHLETTGRYDNAVLVISTGAMAMAMTFIDKIIPETKSIYFLLTACGLLLLSLISELLTLRFSYTSCKKQIEILDEEYETRIPRKNKKFDNIYIPLTNIGSYFALITLIIGILFLALFLFINTKHKEENEMSKKTNQPQKMVNTGDKIEGSYTPAKNKLPPPPPPTKK